MAGIGREALAPETFRPRVLIRTVVLAADSLWVGVFLALVLMRGATASSFLSAAFFITLFSACAAFYHRLSFTVSDRGLTVRTFSLERVYSYEDILRVDVLPGLIGTSYAVRTRPRLAAVLQPPRRPRAPLRLDRAEGATQLRVRAGAAKRVGGRRGWIGLRQAEARRGTGATAPSRRDMNPESRSQKPRRASACRLPVNAH